MWHTLYNKRDIPNASFERADIDRTSHGTTSDALASDYSRLHIFLQSFSRSSRWQIKFVMSQFNGSAVCCSLLTACAPLFPFRYATRAVETCKNSYCVLSNISSTYFTCWILSVELQSAKFSSVTIADICHNRPATKKSTAKRYANDCKLCANVTQITQRVAFILSLGE